MNESDLSKQAATADEVCPHAPRCSHIAHLRVWVVAAVACAAITLFFAFSILLSNQDTREQIDRIIVQGAEANGLVTVMHQVSLTRRDGSTVQLDVSGTATPAQVVEYMTTFFAGDDVPDTWKVTEWTTADGGTIKVTTPPLPGEVPGGLAHCARHDAFVAELQERFPPV